MTMEVKAKNRRKFHEADFTEVRLSLEIKIMLKHVQTKPYFEDVQIDQYLNLSINIHKTDTYSTQTMGAWRKKKELV